MQDLFVANMVLSGVLGFHGWLDLWFFPSTSLMVRSDSIGTTYSLSARGPDQLAGQPRTMIQLVLPPQKLDRFGPALDQPLHMTTGSKLFSTM